MLKPNKLANNNFLSSLDLSTEEVIEGEDLKNLLAETKMPA